MESRKLIRRFQFNSSLPPTHPLLIRSPDGKTYEIRRKDGQCTCPFFVKHEGRHPCKHLLGWPKLMLSQRARISQMTAALEASHG